MMAGWMVVVVATCAGNMLTESMDGIELWKTLQIVRHESVGA